MKVDMLLSDILDQLTRAPHGDVYSVTMEPKLQPFPLYSVQFGTPPAEALKAVAEMIEQGYVETYQHDAHTVAYRLTRKGYERANNELYLGRFNYAADWFTYRTEFEEADALLPETLIDLMATVRADMDPTVQKGILTSEVIALVKHAIEYGRYGTSDVQNDAADKSERLYMQLAAEAELGINRYAEPMPEPPVDDRDYDGDEIASVYFVSLRYVLSRGFFIRANSAEQAQAFAIKNLSDYQEFEMQDSEIEIAVCEPAPGNTPSYDATTGDMAVDSDQ